MSSTATDYYHDQYYYSDAYDAYDIVADEIPLGHDLLDPSDCFPSTIEELNQEIQYWRGLNIMNSQPDSARTSSFNILELQRYRCIDDIVNILETISSYVLCCLVEPSDMVLDLTKYQTSAAARPTGEIF